METMVSRPRALLRTHHGEMIRDGHDQQLTVDTCRLQYLYQGLDPGMATLPYNSLAWRLGLLTSH
jgi:endo-1,4-beta-xylanase